MQRLYLLENVGRTIEYHANMEHPFYSKNFQALVRKYAGVDKLVEILIKKLGHVNTVYLVGGLCPGD